MGKNKLKSFKYYYGIPHAHTLFSTGKGTPYEAFEYAKNNKLDFLVITDHNSYLQKEISKNHKNISKWMTSVNMANRFKKKYEEFIPILGFETQTNNYGDFNIINPNTFFTGVLKNLKLLVLWMYNNPNAFITINHPHKNILLLEYNELLNKVITSIEVGNGSSPNKYIRHDKYYYSLLDKGWKLGAINGQDNHRLNFGDDENLTVFLAKDLSIENLIFAFRERLTYSTESKSLKLLFTINNEIMGKEIIINSPLIKFFIFAEDKNRKIISIEIVSNKNTIIKKVSDLNLNSIKYMYEHEICDNETWFIIRIYQEENKMAISSPIFINS
ncbi:MAG: CehA/McbA family metallohydrolase [Clostridiales bacterium]|nr:CehA/McbA family metallohydrolase [Clostridiales bacterium]